jgi:hypothetical protein
MVKQQAKCNSNKLNQMPLNRKEKGRENNEKKMKNIAQERAKNISKILNKS